MTEPISSNQIVWLTFIIMGASVFIALVLIHIEKLLIKILAELRARGKKG